MFSSFFGGNRNNNNNNFEGHDGRGANPGSNIGRGNANPQNLFLRSYKCYSPAFIGKPEIERGNKIIMPESALHELSRIHTSYPMTFMISNPEMGIKSYCGNLEFVAQEGTCNIPIWMMNLLCIEEGSEVIVRNVNLKKGTHVKFQPHETAFIDIPGFKEILEHELTYYTCLHKGDTICITHAKRQYLVNITDCKPDEQICCVETDLNTEFDPPLDYVEPKAVPLTRASKSTKEKEETAINEKKIAQVADKLTRLDGKPLTEAQKSELLKKIKQEEAHLDFDPRKFRLKHGIRNYVEPGSKMTASSVAAFKGTGVKLA